MRNQKIHPNYQGLETEINSLIDNFESITSTIGKGDRNSIKVADLNGEAVAIKSFKKPNFINKVVYNFFRKSKAQRSYEYANKLKDLEIGTPQPISYLEFKSPIFFENSYYICKHLDCDLTYRELTFNFNYPDFERILREFTRFTYNLHKKGVHFLDHSPGNTLIKQVGNDYQFFLVDLNRMEFGAMDFETRIKNFSRLTTHRNMVEIMSEEYAKCSGEDYTKILDLMWSSTEKFQDKFHRKKRLKKQLMFWRG